MDLREAEKPVAPATPEVAAGPRWWGTWRVIIAVVGLSIALTCIMMLLFGTWGIEETGPVETVQVVMWLVPAVFACCGVVWVETREARQMLIFYGGMGLAAGAREADMHLLPRNLGAWSMHFRLSWWTSSAAPVLPRLMWLTVLVAIAALTAYVVIKSLPLIFRTYKWMPGLLALAIGFAMMGWVADDLLRAALPHNLARQVAEETFETMAALMITALVGRVWYDYRYGGPGSPRARA